MSMVQDCLAALRTSAVQVPIAFDLIRRRDWASALFSGERLRVAAACDSDDALDIWLAALPDADLPLPGAFVASAEVVERRARHAMLELLVVAA